MVGAKDRLTYLGSALSCAVGTGNTEVIRIVLAANITTPDSWQKALALAARRGNLEVMQLLIDANKSELNLEDYRHAVSQAALGGHAEILRFLLAERHFFSSEINNSVPRYR